MRDICIKCGKEKGSNPSSKLNSIGEFSICRSCGKSYFETIYRNYEYCQKFYDELVNISQIHPERLSEKASKEDAIV